MRTSFLIAAAAVCLMSAAVVAQPANHRGDTPAVNTPNSPPNPGAPVAGANSFTENQAKDRAMAAGFTSVSALTKDENGIWRGTASKDGNTVNVAVDYKGNVVAN